MKNSPTSYSSKEIIEMLDRAKAHIEMLERQKSGQAPANQKRFSPPQSESLGNCPDCGDALIPGKYSPYCFRCWVAKKEQGK